MAHRHERTNEEIKEKLSLIIPHELKDPRLTGRVIGITRAKTTPDLKYCNILISIYDEKGNKDEILSVIENAKGYIRKRLADSLEARRAPELIFELDDTLDNAMYIESLLRKINEK